MKGLCTLIDNNKGARIALCMNSQREEIVNLIYTLIYGKRKLKSLSDCKIAIFADQSYYNQESGQLDVQKLHAQTGFESLLLLSDAHIIQFKNGQ